MTSGRRRVRRPPAAGEFHDPLSNYEAPTYADEMERTLDEDRVTTLQLRPFCSVTPETCIRDALARMEELDVACLVVVEDERPVGILSERDVLLRIAERYEDLASQPVREVMTPEPVVVYESESPARLLNLMGSGLFRHVPVVDVDGRLMGMIGARRVTAYLEAHASV